MSENFLPIPSLDNLYEINPQGVVKNLLLEVQGIKINLQNVYQYNFQSLKELAKEKSEIGIWKIKYFDEPKPNVKAGHSKKHRRRN